jgi:predicted enzyme related to lactoylglutathione lyase
MGERSSYPPGSFSWVDLATTDAAAARSFYAGLFGWETEDADAGGGVVYTMCRHDGDAVCGLFEMSDDMRATGIPPNWTSYVTVADADAAAARSFYEGLFGWTTEMVDTGPGGPSMGFARNGGRINASLFADRRGARHEDGRGPRVLPAR